MFGQSEEEAAFIDQLAKDQNPNENQEYWIGLYRNEKGTLGESLQPDNISRNRKLNGIYMKFPSLYHSLTVLEKNYFNQSLKNLPIGKIIFQDSS